MALLIISGKNSSYLTSNIIKFVSVGATGSEGLKILFEYIPVLISISNVILTLPSSYTKASLT